MFEEFDRVLNKKNGKPGYIVHTEFYPRGETRSGIVVYYVEHDDGSQAELLESEMEHSYE